MDTYVNSGNVMPFNTIQFFCFVYRKIPHAHYMILLNFIAGKHFAHKYKYIYVCVRVLSTYICIFITLTYVDESLSNAYVYAYA